MITITQAVQLNVIHQARIPIAIRVKRFRNTNTQYLSILNSFMAQHPLKW
jgi:hypothetical protein